MGVYEKIQYAYTLLTVLPRNLCKAFRGTESVAITMIHISKCTLLLLMFRPFTNILLTSSLSLKRPIIFINLCFYGLKFVESNLE